MLWNRFFREFRSFCKKTGFSELNYDTEDTFCDYLNNYFNKNYPDPSIVITAESIVKQLIASLEPSKERRSNNVAKDPDWAKKRADELVLYAEEIANLYAESETRNAIKNDTVYFTRTLRELEDSSEEKLKKKILCDKLKNLIKPLSNALGEKTRELEVALNGLLILHGLSTEYNGKVFLIDKTYENCIDSIKKLNREQQNDILSMFQLILGLNKFRGKILRDMDSIDELDFDTLKTIGDELDSIYYSLISYLKKSLKMVETQLSDTEIEHQILKNDIDLIILVFNFDYDSWIKATNELDPNIYDLNASNLADFTANFKILLPFMAQNKITSLSELRTHKLELEQYLDSLQMVDKPTTERVLKNLVNTFDSDTALLEFIGAIVYASLLYNIDDAQSTDTEKLRYVHSIFGIEEKQKLKNRGEILILKTSSELLQAINFKIDDLGRISKKDLAHLTVEEREHFINDNKNSDSYVLKTACLSAKNFNDFTNRALAGKDLHRLTDTELDKQLENNTKLLLALEKASSPNLYDISLRTEYDFRLRNALNERRNLQIADEKPSKPSA